MAEHPEIDDLLRSIYALADEGGLLTVNQQCHLDEMLMRGMEAGDGVEKAVMNALKVGSAFIALNAMLAGATSAPTATPGAPQCS